MEISVFPCLAKITGFWFHHHCQTINHEPSAPCAALKETARSTFLGSRLRTPGGLVCQEYQMWLLLGKKDWKPSFSLLPFHTSHPNALYYYLL